MKQRGGLVLVLHAPALPVYLVLPDVLVFSASAAVFKTTRIHQDYRA